MNKNELIGVIEMCYSNKSNLKKIKDETIRLLIESIINSKTHIQIKKELSK